MLVVCNLAYDEIFSGGDEKPCLKACPIGKECINDGCVWAGAAHCGEDLDCIFRQDARFECQYAIENLAKYDYEWTSFLERFTIVRWEDKDLGLIEGVGNSIKFQNVFGAYQQHTYFCTYNLATKGTDVSVTPH